MCKVLFQYIFYILFHEAFVVFHGQSSFYSITLMLISKWRTISPSLSPRLQLFRHDPKIYLIGYRLRYACQEHCFPFPSSQAWQRFRLLCSSGNTLFLAKFNSRHRDPTSATSCARVARFIMTLSRRLYSSIRIAGVKWAQLYTW